MRIHYSIFCLALAAFFVPLAARAQLPAEADFAPADAAVEDVPSPSDDVPAPGEETATHVDFAMPAPKCCCAPRWTVAADALFLKRENSQRVLFEEFATGDPALSLPDFNAEAGIRGSVIRHRDCASDIEFAYFGVNEMSATGAVVGTPSQFAMNNLYGLSFGDIDAASVAYESDLDSFELNLRDNSCNERVTWLIGFRYISIDDRLLIADTFLGGLQESFATQTSNDLYAIQFGFDAVVYQSCRAQVHLITKAGVFYNDHEQASRYDTDPAFLPSGQFADEGKETSYMSEVQVAGTYCVTPRLSVRGGYHMLFLSEVATAGAQIDSVSLDTQPAGFVGGAVSTDDVLYHGAFFGIEWVR